MRYRFISKIEIDTLKSPGKNVHLRLKMFLSVLN